MFRLLLTTHEDFNYMEDPFYQNGFADVSNIVTKTGATIYQIVFRIGIFGCVFALMLCGISFLLKGDDSRNRTELKTWLFRIGIVLLAMTSLTAIFGLIGNLMTSVF